MSCILVPYHLDQHLAHREEVLDPDSTLDLELPDGDVWERMTVLYEAVADAVATEAQSGRGVVVMSADCTTSLGAVAGLQRAGLDAGLVWFDAHGDVQTLETSESGYVGGMPLRMLLGYRPDLVAEPLGLRPVMEERAALVDARDLDPPEIEYLAASSIRRCGVYELSVDDVPDGPLYVHVDLDVVDPSELPGLMFPVPGGPGIGPVLAALRRLLESQRVAALGLACTWRSGYGTAERLRGPLLDVLDGCGYLDRSSGVPG